MASNRRSASPAKDVSAVGVEHDGRRRAERRLDQVRRSPRRRRAPGRARRRCAAGRRGSLASPSRAVHRQQHDRGQMRGVDRQRVGRRGDRDEPGADAQRAARRQPRRAGARSPGRRRRRRGRGRYLWPSTRGTRQRSHSPGTLRKVRGRIVVEHRRVDADVGDDHPARMRAARAAAGGRASAGRRSPSASPGSRVPSTAPVRPSMPLGRSTARTGSAGSH